MAASVSSGRFRVEGRRLKRSDTSVDQGCRKQFLVGGFDGLDSGLVAKGDTDVSVKGVAQRV